MGNDKRIPRPPPRPKDVPPMKEPIPEAPRVFKPRARSQRNKIATSALIVLGTVPQITEPLEAIGVIPPFTTKLVLGVGAMVGALANHLWKK